MGLRTAAWAIGLLALGGGAAGAQAAPDGPPVGKAPILVYEDFETTGPGDAPKGWQKQGEASVAQDAAHSGRHSLKIGPATNGPRRITLKNAAVASLGGSHWGRLLYKVALPSPTVASGVVHSTIVSAMGKSPLHKDEIEFRPVDTILHTSGKFSYIWNVQPRGGRGEFASGGAAEHAFTDQWTLVEWFVDHATQTFRFYQNGKELKDVGFSKGAGKFEKAEIPEAVESLTIGWWNYQAAGAGFTAWIDDFAVSKERLGLRGIPLPKKKASK